MYEEEKKLRNLQFEAIKFLWREVKTLQKWQEEITGVPRSGVNGKIPYSSYKFSTLDCRATRGPLTRDFLKHEFNVTSPEVFGDPALLLPIFCPELNKYICSNHQVTIVPNLNDFSDYNNSSDLIHPCSSFDQILKRILSTDFVVGSSLHAIIIAEAFGKSARFIKSVHENEFKYLDYCYATGRSKPKFATNLQHAFDLGPMPPIQFDAISLLKAFPFDLFDS